MYREPSFSWQYFFPMILTIKRHIMVWWVIMAFFFHNYSMKQILWILVRIPSAKVFWKYPQPWVSDTIFLNISNFLTSWARYFLHSNCYYNEFCSCNEPLKRADYRKFRLTMVKNYMYVRPRAPLGTTGNTVKMKQWKIFFFFLFFLWKMSAKYAKQNQSQKNNKICNENFIVVKGEKKYSGVANLKNQQQQKKSPLLIGSFL